MLNERMMEREKTDINEGGRWDEAVGSITYAATGAIQRKPCCGSEQGNDSRLSIGTQLRLSTDVHLGAEGA